MWGLGLYTEKEFTTILIIAAVVGIVVAFVMGFVCRTIVRGKGYPDELNHGFAWGFWLGVIGLIVCAVKPNYNQNNQFYYNGQPMNGQAPYGQPYQGQPPYGQPYQGQPMNGQPYQGQPMNGQPYQGQPYQGQPPYGQPYNAQGGNEWYCSCGAANPPEAKVCQICGNTRGNDGGQQF